MPQPLRQTCLAADPLDRSAAEVLGMLGQLELLRQRARLDDRAAKLAGRIEQLAPYVARATKAIEDGRGVLRELLRLDTELAIEDAPHAAIAERQYREIVDELESEDR